MALEIERRFIVTGNEWKEFAKNVENFQQGYLSSNSEEWAIRIRIVDKEQAQLTLKKPLMSEYSKYEFEYEIPLSDAKSILNLIYHKLEKKRYSLNYGPGEWIIDCFQGKNHPLVLAEVELETEKQRIKKPNWCKTEISKVKKLSNASLAHHPISAWSIEELEVFNLARDKQPKNL